MVKNRLGRRYGRLVVVKFSGSPPPKYNATWECVCDCGNVCVVVGHKLGKDTWSCGCLHRDVTSAKKRTHGESHGEKQTVLYTTWCRAKTRCSPDWVEARNYYLRGIRVCPQWERSYTEFRDWIIKNIGHRPSKNHSLDRIDNDKGYEPGNVRWATRSEQTRNTRYTVRVCINGVIRPLLDICEERNLNAAMVRARLRSGWSINDAINLPRGTWRQGIRKKVHVYSDDPHYQLPPQPGPPQPLEE